MTYIPVATSLQRDYVCRFLNPHCVRAPSNRPRPEWVSSRFPRHRCVSPLHDDGLHPVHNGRRSKTRRERERSICTRTHLVDPLFSIWDSMEKNNIIYTFLSEKKRYCVVVGTPIQPLLWLIRKRKSNEHSSARRARIARIAVQFECYGVPIKYRVSTRLYRYYR